MKHIFMSILLIASLGACSINPGKQTQVLSLMVAAANIAAVYDSGEPVEFLDNAPLTDDEIATVVDALDIGDAALAKFKGIEKRPGELANIIPNLSAEYAKVKVAYMSVREVAVAHRDDYTAEEWEVLSSFDVIAKEIDQQFVGFLETASEQEAILQVLALTATALQVAALL